MSQQLQEFGQTNEAGQTAYLRLLTRDAAIENMRRAVERQTYIETQQSALAPVTVPTPEVVANPIMSQEVAASVPIQRTAPEAVTPMPLQAEAPEMSTQPAPDQPSLEQLSQDAYDLAA